MGVFGDALLLTPLCICNPAKLESVMCVSRAYVPGCWVSGLPSGSGLWAPLQESRGWEEKEAAWRHPWRWLSLALAVAAPSSQPSFCRVGSCGQFPSGGPGAPVRPPPATAPLASRWSWLPALLISAFSPSHPTFRICCHLGNQFPALSSLSCLFLR